MGLNNIPVLYIAFARPEYASKSFNAIRFAKPKKLYFYSNKGRKDHDDELQRNNQVRLMLKNVDWDCDLKTWFREEPVDVYTSLWGAINWLFENEEKGIIIEEDCVISPAFLDFTEKMLLKYEKDQRIWMIGGSNYIEGYNPHNHDYHFSHNMFIHGWASWRNRWESVDWNNPPLQKMIEENVFDAIFNSKLQRIFHKKRFESYIPFVTRTKCWDIIFCATGRSNNALAVLPERNLVNNIGTEGVHTHSTKKNIAFNGLLYNNEEYDINNEPPFVIADVLYDERVFRVLHYDRLSLKQKILLFIK